jgi:hypothetical protein
MTRIKALVVLVGLLAMPSLVLAQGQLYNTNMTVTGTINGGTTTGSGNAYVLALAPPITAYTTNQCFTFKANFTNSAAATLNINGLGAKALKKYVSAVVTDLAANDVTNGQIIHTCYDGTNMQLVGTGSTSGGGGGGVSNFITFSAAAYAMTNYGGL